MSQVPEIVLDSTPATAASPAGAASSPAEIDDLLAKTSRTFALAIPLLPEPTRQQVSIAYLLFRIADTFEDAELWPRERKLDALARFERLLLRPAPDEARREAAGWLAEPPCADAGYLELLRQTPAVLGAFWLLDEGPRQLIGEHTRRTVEGMARFVRRATAGGDLELADLEDLKAYCYVVAGIVGEMLTELFLVGRRALAPVRSFLRERSARFGEALQLVNIIKDSLADAGHGRRFLPPGSSLAEVVTLARKDLQVAMRYTLGLQRAGAPRGIVAFAALPVRLAQATLDLVEQRGPGVKLSRPEVSRIVEALDLALDQGLPAV
ncbi:MAG TPA: squalene/phytoene synthase family protein [Thermoanaerobaculia bacterium]|nr:squalene/phytoene synthase family protein [Thermoanaerobaculia bacterium]